MCFFKERREQTTGTKYHTIFKNVNILEFHDHIWNHHEKCIQKSTNMPIIGSLIREIDVHILKISKQTFTLRKTKGRVLSIVLSRFARINL